MMPIVGRCINCVRWASGCPEWWRWIKIKVSGRLSGKPGSREHVWGLRVLVCVRVLPGRLLYQRQRNRAAIYGKEKVYGSIP